MGMLVNGQWHVAAVNPATPDGEFRRQTQMFREQISAEPSAKYSPEAGRYHLYVSYACPWAHRVLLYWQLKGLQNIISVSVVHPVMGEMGWCFLEEDFPEVTHDAVNHCFYLKDIYLLADPQFTGRVTVPVLWDKLTQTIVNNESADIIRMFNTVFDQLTGNRLDFYPSSLRPQINEVNDFIYHNINNGVYKVGFATTQEAYERNYHKLFDALDDVEERLAKHDYLVDHVVTEADWRLFTTLVRFDPVYVVHFKCNRQYIHEFPYLSHYLLRLFDYPGVRQTVYFDHIKTHYFASHRSINPTGIIPVGPELEF